VAKLYSNVV